MHLGHSQLILCGEGVSHHPKTLGQYFQQQGVVRP